MKQYLTAPEVAEIAGVSIGKAYSLIREMNTELKAEGYITNRRESSREVFSV